MPHTPGPWKWVIDNSPDKFTYIWHDRRDCLVATIAKMDDFEGEEFANANLIAAAPMLLEAAKELESHFIAPNELWLKHVNKLRAAIAAAEGKEGGEQ